MNTQTFTRAMASTKWLLVAFVLLVSMGWSGSVHAGWKIKFDRESTDMRGESSRPFMLERELPTTYSPRTPSSVNSHSTDARAKISGIVPVKEISLILTDEGFLPKKLYLKQGELYQITVVNVHSDHKNASFVVPSLAIYEGTYFASPQTIELLADQEGLFHFLSPESGEKGELVVYESSSKPPVPIRLPAGRE